MAKTIQQQWDDLQDHLDKMGNDFIESYYRDMDKPTVVYELNSYKSIGELPIVGIVMWYQGRPYYDKRPTRILLAEFEKYVASYIPKDSDIRLRWEIKREGGGSSSSAIKPTDIDDKRYSLSRELLLPRQEELRQLYEPREGYIACTYCRKQIPENEAVDYTVIARQYPNMRKTAKYCPGNCGPYDQMAHEG
jgi:hypothetical protein